MKKTVGFGPTISPDKLSTDFMFEHFKPHFFKMGVKAQYETLIWMISEWSNELETRKPGSSGPALKKLYDELKTSEKASNLMSGKH